MRDGWGHGQGWGKRLFGLLVIKANKGGFATKGLLGRQFHHPGAHLVDRGRLVLARPDGRRLGDLLAQTRVVAEKRIRVGRSGAYDRPEAPGVEDLAAVTFIISAIFIASSIGLISFPVSRLAPGACLR